MTILAAIIRTDHVVAWTDSETFAADGKPSGRFNKLRFAATGPVIGFGGGWHDLLGHADAAVADATDVDDAAAKVTAALRANMTRAVTGSHARHPEEFGCQLYVVAGWSRSAGRMLAYVMAGTALFAPVLVSRIASPEVGAFDRLHPTSDEHVAAYAREQMTELRKHCPGATGGDLLIGTLSPAGTYIRALRDFAAIETDETLEQAA